MSSDRFTDRVTIANSSLLYKKKFKGKRGKYVIQYATKRTPEVTDEIYAEWEIDEYVWKYNDTYQSLAQDYYGDMAEWWRIAWFNKKPSETTLEIGSIILIPVYLSEIKEYLGY